MKNRVIKGDTVEEQIRSIDQFLVSLRRKVRKKIILGQVPIPVSGFCDCIKDNGIFLRYISPFDGMITMLSYDFVGRFEKGTTVSAHLLTPKGETRGQKVAVEAGPVSMPVEWEIKAGDKIIMYVDHFMDLPAPDINGQGGTIFEEIWTWFSLFPALREHNFVQEDIPIEEDGV
uniref:Uncharacterized protein n=1 Tax=viral metagenome TaxID=1070528 RepID=A0A6M3KN66_9ZZZZ